ncbi:MAG TPA: hypothetical protein VIR58_15185, partial [Acidimicrobiales bacterium]
RFLAAVRDGDVEGLLAVLAPDAVMVADGGGVVSATRRPVQGAERVARLLAQLAGVADIEVSAVWLNGSPGARLDIGGKLDTAVGLTVSGGRITHVYGIRNPHKLAGLAGVADLTRT